MADFEHFKGFFEEVTGKPYGVIEKPQKGAKKTVKGAKDEGEPSSTCIDIKIKNGGVDDG